MGRTKTLQMDTNLEVGLMKYWTAAVTASDNTCSFLMNSVAADMLAKKRVDH